jgi:regulator of ribonuclease activity A
VTTADVLDAHPDAQVCLLQFRSFGAASFSGLIQTVQCFEDNVVLKATVSEPGDGRVLVVDGDGSQRCALLGDNIASIALGNGWAGVVLNACVRDSAALDALDSASKTFGVKAIGTNPRPSAKGGAGEVGVPVTFGEATFTPGAQLYADGDGVVVVPA